MANLQWQAKAPAPPRIRKQGAECRAGARSLTMGWKGEIMMVAMAVFASEEERWNAVARRDGAADGAFYYSVRTTGVYCRPSCASRRARRREVGFPFTCAAARGMGPSIMGCGRRACTAGLRARRGGRGGRMSFSI